MHFAIASSSVAESEVGDEGRERIVDWISQTETVVKEVEATPRPRREHSQKTVTAVTAATSPLPIRENQSLRNSSQKQAHDSSQIQPAPKVPLPSRVPASSEPLSVLEKPLKSYAAHSLESASLPKEILVDGLDRIQTTMHVMISWGMSNDTHKNNRIDKSTLMVLEVDPSDDIRRFKAQVMGETGIPVEHQQLVFLGQELQDNLSLSDYRIENFDTIYANKRNFANKQ